MQLFIDTNILLSFYSLNQEDLAELNKLIEAIDKQQITLLFTDQIINEFYRNREQRIDGAIKSLRSQTFNPQFPQLCEDYPEIDTLRESLKHYEQAHSSLTTRILADIKTKTLKADRIIQSLFSLGKKLANSQMMLDRARLRMGVGNNFAKGQQVDFVLSHFSQEEFTELPAIMDKASEMILSFCTMGAERTMSLLNGK